MMRGVWLSTRPVTVAPLLSIDPLEALTVIIPSHSKRKVFSRLRNDGRDLGLLSLRGDGQQMSISQDTIILSLQHRPEDRS